MLKPFLRSLRDKPAYNKHSTNLEVQVSTQDGFDQLPTIKTAIRDDAVYDWISSDTFPNLKCMT